MIPCTHFIPAYSELFKYISEKDGHSGVVAFWEFLSYNFLGNLKTLVEENGIMGCWLYWKQTLNEEAADFSMEVDEEKGIFTIEMHHCPSKGRLLEYKHFSPYKDYCLHCDLLYRRILEPLGYEYNLDLSHCDEAKCVLQVKKSDLQTV